MQVFVLCLDEGLKLKVNHGVLNSIKYSGKVILSTLLLLIIVVLFCSNCMIVILEVALCK